MIIIGHDIVHHKNLLQQANLDFGCRKTRHANRDQMSIIGHDTKLYDKTCVRKIVSSKYGCLVIKNWE
jgi:hypothetical protein